MKDVPVQGLLQDVAMVMQPLAAEKGSQLRIETVCRDEPLFARCDPPRLTQILNNLVSNACKYGAGTPVVVRATATRRSSLPDTLRVQEEDGDVVLFDVVDGGLGMSDAETKILFEPYHRLHRHSGIKGTGLGLSIVKVLVELHGGRIAVKSTEGILVGHFGS